MGDTTGIEMDAAALNAKLAGASYLSGHIVSTADLAQFESMAGPPSADAHPHAARWYKHMSSYSLGERLRFRSADGGAAPAPAAASSQAAPAGDEKKMTKAEKKAAKASGKKGGDKAEKKDDKKGGDAEAEEKARKKLIAKVEKEGGKRGVEIEGECDMGGLAFFCLKLDEPDGDMELLKLGFEAMNAEPDPTAEERRGGAGAVGKVVFSAGQTQLAMVCNVPKNRQVDNPNMDAAKPASGAMKAREWVEYVCAPLKAAKLKAEISGDDDFAQAVVQSDPEAGHFAIKMKDESLKMAYKLLNERHWFDDKSDSESDIMIGENPCADDY